MMMPAPLRILVAVFLGAGLIIGAVAAMLSLGCRKPGISLKESYWAGSDLAAHPERYFDPEAAATLRRLFLVSVCSWLAGILTLVGYSIFELAID